MSSGTGVFLKLQNDKEASSHVSSSSNRPGSTQDDGGRPLHQQQHAMGWGGVPLMAQRLSPQSGGQQPRSRAGGPVSRNNSSSSSSSTASGCFTSGSSLMVARQHSAPDCEPHSGDLMALDSYLEPPARRGSSFSSAASSSSRLRLLRNRHASARDLSSTLVLPQPAAWMADAPAASARASLASSAGRCEVLSGPLGPTLHPQQETRERPGAAQAARNNSSPLSGSILLLDGSHNSPELAAYTDHSTALPIDAAWLAGMGIGTGAPEAAAWTTSAGGPDAPRQAMSSATHSHNNSSNPAAACLPSGCNSPAATMGTEPQLTPFTELSALHWGPGTSYFQGPQLAVQGLAAGASSASVLPVAGSSLGGAQLQLPTHSLSAPVTGTGTSMTALQQQAAALLQLDDTQRALQLVDDELQQLLQLRHEITRQAGAGAAPLQATNAHGGPSSIAAPAPVSQAAAGLAGLELSAPPVGHAPGFAGSMAAARAAVARAKMEQLVAMQQLQEQLQQELLDMLPPPGRF